MTDTPNTQPTDQTTRIHPDWRACHSLDELVNGLASNADLANDAAYRSDLMQCLLRAQQLASPAAPDRTAIKMLVAAGFVTEAKANEALCIAHGFEKGPLTPQPPSGEEVREDLIDDLEARAPCTDEVSGDLLREAARVLRKIVPHRPAPPSAAARVDAKRLVPPEWISDQVGGVFDDITTGQAWRMGFNECRARTVSIIEQAALAQQPAILPSATNGITGSVSPEMQTPSAPVVDDPDGSLRWLDRRIADLGDEDKTTELYQHYVNLRSMIRPSAPVGVELPRYGFPSGGESRPVPCADGYWTPWHLAQQPAACPAHVHCDNCGLDWLDNGLNPIGCPYCRQPAAESPLAAIRKSPEYALEKARLEGYIEGRADALSEPPAAVDGAMVERALAAYMKSRGSYMGEVPPDADDIRAALIAALATQPGGNDDE